MSTKTKAPKPYTFHREAVVELYREAYLDELKMLRALAIRSGIYINNMEFAINQHNGAVGILNSLITTRIAMKHCPEPQEFTLTIEEIAKEVLRIDMMSGYGELVDLGYIEKGTIYQESLPSFAGEYSSFVSEVVSVINRNNTSVPTAFLNRMRNNVDDASPERIREILADIADWKSDYHKQTPEWYTDVIGFNYVIDCDTVDVILSGSFQTTDIAKFACSLLGSRAPKLTKIITEWAKPKESLIPRFLR